MKKSILLMPFRTRASSLSAFVVRSYLPWTSNNQRLNPRFSNLVEGRTFTFHRSCSQRVLIDDEITHDVQGIICREVRIDVDVVGPVCILEATADSQNQLVDMALMTEEEIKSENPSLRLESGDPYGSVLWPAASAVINHLLTNVAQELRSEGKQRFEDATILELGTGTGLVSLAAALGGASKVKATDYEKVPLRLLEYAAEHINCISVGDDDLITGEERVEKLSKIETSLFDICNHEKSLPDADIVVAADIMYEPKTGIAMAHRVVEALKTGRRVIVGCSPGRPGRPKFQEELRRLLPGINCDFTEVEGRTCSGPRNELICGENSTTISSSPKVLKVALLDLDPSCLIELE